MTARGEERREDRPRGSTSPALWALLGLLAACFAISDLIAAMAMPGPRAWQPLGVLAANLLMVGAVWGLSRLRPSIPKALVLAMLLAVIAFAGFSVAVKVAQITVAARTLQGPWPWQAVVVFGSNVLIGVGGIWGLLLLQPWKGWRDPDEEVSPSTRRANKLFGLKELLAAVAMLALMFGAGSHDHPLAAFSNSPVPLWVAVVAITTWLLARLLREWWGSSADEHEQRISDFGRRVGAGGFLAVTPAWWVAARAGLLPQPDVMVVWLLTWMLTSIAWSWRRSN